jgi:alpha-tubulin suppressor-like RCC1 family protein
MAIQQYLMMANRSAAGRELKTGALYTMGVNWDGNLGNGDTTNHPFDPVQVLGGTDWQNTTTMSEARSVVAVKGDGTLWSWGNGSNGALGQGSTTDINTPTQIGSDTDWQSAVSTGTSSSSAIKTNGTLWTWGKNDYGQLGHGDTTERTTPAQVGSLTDWYATIPHDNRTFYWLKTDGTIWYCGNLYGVADVSTPIQLGSDTDWTDAWQGYSSGTYNQNMFLMKA